LFDVLIPISELIQNDSSFQETIFLKTLDFSGASGNQNSFPAFRCLIEIACRLKSKLLLSAQHSQKLRDILLQGFRSSAREPLRDNFIIATMVFLSHLDPAWTLNPSSSRGDNKFVMLIVSLICGEYRLLLQELTTLSTESEDGEVNDESKVQTDLAMAHHRSHRAKNLCCVCSEIFDAVFSLLVGDGAEGEDEEEATGCWQSLSAGTLQLIQKVSFPFHLLAPNISVLLSQEMTLSIELFFQFLSLCRKSLQKGNSSEDLRPVVIRGLMSFSLWIREDESLHSLLVDSYEDLIQFSKLPTLDYTQTSTIHLSQAMKEQTLALLFQTPSPDSLDESDSTKISGGVGSVLLLRTRVRSSSLSSLPQQQQPHELRNEILLLSETFLDPFVSTLDCVLTILSADTMSQKLSSVAICALPQIHSSLVTLLSDMQRFLARRQQQQQQMAIEIQQELSLCSIISEFLFHLLISPTNQMRESLQVVATSSDPAAGEYLRVSCGGWKTLISEITVVAQLGNRGGADLLSRSELVDYQNLVERLGSLEELLRNLFHL
jgi:hypothetical protein